MFVNSSRSKLLNLIWTDMLVSSLSFPLLIGLEEHNKLMSKVTDMILLYNPREYILALQAVAAVRV